MNSNYRALLSDFGSARRIPPSDSAEPRNHSIPSADIGPALDATVSAEMNTITLTGNAYTLRWAAPEVLEEEDNNIKSDIWAMGWVFFEVTA